MHPGVSTPVQFRVATEADASAVAALFTEYLASLALTPDAELDADMADFPRAFTGPGDTFLLVTGGDGTLLGMGGLRRGELRRTFIRPQHRSQGLARLLALRLLQAGLATGQQELRAVVARDNPASQEKNFACGLLPTGRTPAHPKQRDCEILALTRPPDLTRPLMVLAGGDLAHWHALLPRFAPQFNLLLVWHASVVAACQAVQAQTAPGCWVGAVRCDLARPARLPFLAEVAHTLAGPCRVLLALPGADATLADLCRAFAPQLAAPPGGRVVRLVASSPPAEPFTLHDLATGEPFFP
jgi:GNAT superfamily N-acetyltransferase